MRVSWCEWVWVGVGECVEAQFLLILRFTEDEDLELKRCLLVVRVPPPPPLAMLVLCCFTCGIAQAACIAWQHVEADW